MTIEIKVFETDTLFLTQQQGSLNYIAQLSDISRPCIGLQSLKTVVIKLDLTPSQIGRDFIQEILGHDRNIINPFA